MVIGVYVISLVVIQLGRLGYKEERESQIVNIRIE